MNIIGYILLFSTILDAGTPLEYSISMTSGYDNNVMRFSKNEFDRAALDPLLMGGSKTFDSFITKWNISAKKSILTLNEKTIVASFAYTLSDYVHTPEKKYWSGGFDVAYKWGAYKNVKYSVRHLDNFYLRHYIDRDISRVQLSPCLFTDRNQSVQLTHKTSKRSWINIGGGYLQRYYAKPFTEFDLDIKYIKGKFNYKIRKFGTLGLQINRGRALSDSHHLPDRPSSFNRSYQTTEWYIPIKINKGIPFLTEIGFSTRIENRQYDTEDPNDPLHAGRSHLDSKYDVWIKKGLSESMSVAISSRYRMRSTNSDYDWVDDLKSFKQLQYWLKIEWDLVYDRY